MPLNTTGLPTPGHYVLGRGILLIGAIDAATGKALDWRDVGNCPTFSYTVETEELEHQSSRGGLKVTDKKVTLSQTTSLNFTLDEISLQNLALFLSGTVATHTNPAKTGVTNYEWIVGNEASTTNLKKGVWYDLVSSTGERLYDILPGNLTLATTAGSPVTLVLGTDYELDTVQGRVFMKSTSTVLTTAIAAFQGITMTYTASAGSKNLDEVRGLTTSNIAYAIKFIGKNPANNNAETEWQFHQVTLSPEGDLSLIGDDWSTIGFTGAAETNALADADAPILRIRELQAS